MAGRRPGGVTLVAVIVVINGILELLGGILALAGVVAIGAGVLAGVPIVAIVLGILTILVGLSLLRGGQIARVITTIVLAIDLAYAILGILQSTGPGAIWSPLVSGVLALLGIVLLWTRRASAFFRG